MPDVPAPLNAYNRTQSERTLRLTRLAIAQLEREHRTVTLAAVVEATRSVDPDRDEKGITATTILRNPEARALFHEHSPAYQERQQRLARVRRKRSRPVTDKTRAEYRGLKATELIALVEELKQTVTTLKQEQVKLKAERDAAYQLRDEALQQNTRQLAALAQSLGRVQASPVKSPGPQGP